MSNYRVHFASIDSNGDSIDVQAETCEGAIVNAIARFDGNVESAEVSDWFMGPIGWKFSDVTPINPIYCRGQQGLWNVEGETLEQCRAAYKEAKSEVQS